MELCPKQIDCLHFQWTRKARSEHVRRTETCLKFNGECSEGWDKAQGPACNLKKVRGLKKTPPFKRELNL